ncbi:MAG: hypothetical protein JNK05_30570 [Myxococcales bacterium]|nr:hypothetical protein [Myxococcales bacterium]
MRWLVFVMLMSCGGELARETDASRADSAGDDASRDGARMEDVVGSDAREVDATVAADAASRDAATDARAADVEAFPPPPNSHDPGDGTRATGGTIVYDARSGNTPGNQTGCRPGAFPNQWIVVVDSFGGGFGLSRPLVMISFPLDLLTRSREFDVRPAPTAMSWAALDQASILFTLTGEPIQFGGGGRVWARIVDRVMEVRFERVPLVDSSQRPTGHVLSVAYRCWDRLP